MKTIEVVAGVIHNQDNEILITKRKHKLFNGLWEFPGGKIESGETHQETLIREIKEELKVDIEVDDFLTTVEYDYPEFHLIMHVYNAKLIKGNIELSVHSEIKWVDKNHLDNLEWVPADIDIVNLLKNN